MVTAPTVQPLEVDDVRKRLRLVSDQFDDFFEPMIAEEVSRAQRITGNYLLSQTLLATRDGFPSMEFDEFTDGFIILLPGPVQSITSVVYDDEFDTEQTLAADQYDLDTSGRVGRLSPSIDASVWPDTSGQMGCVRITYVAGKATAAEVPPDVKRALLTAILWRFDGYDDREKLDDLYHCCETY